MHHTEGSDDAAQGYLGHVLEVLLMAEEALFLFMH